MSTGQGEQAGELYLSPACMPALTAWFKEHARDLPWRQTKDPYRIWVSEIMLQQTRVEAVKPYYARFLAQLPDVRALAACPPDQLLKLWEGLGYYSRARNMQKAARIICDDYDGLFPSDYDRIRALPGIGDYTAGAVSSIAFGQARPAVDGNVMRVVSRLTGSMQDITTKQAKEAVQTVLQGRISRDEPGICNQALMELGALICLPGKAAGCGACPLSGMCRAFAEGLTEQIPVKSPKKARRIQKKTVLVIRDGLQAVLGRRSQTGLLAGLYELPSLEGHQNPEAVVAAVRAMGLDPVRIRHLGPARHVFTHIEWDMDGYMVLVEDLGPLKQEGLFAAAPQHIQESLPVPAAFSAYTKYLNIVPGGRGWNKVEPDRP